MHSPPSGTFTESRCDINLPTEIFEHILEEVYNYRYTSTLRNCTLVNSFFCALSQRRLLRNVVINLDPDVRRNWPSRSVPPAPCAVDKFVEFLRHAPHLSQCIHVLTIVSDTLYPFIRSDTDHWIAGDSSLPPLMQILTNLRSFRVKMKKDISQWVDKSTPFIMARNDEETLFDVLPQTLTEIDLEMENVPFRYFQSCNWIKNLSVISLDCTIPKTSPSPRHSPSRLKRLTLKSIPPKFLSWLSHPECPLKSGCLESLILDLMSTSNMTSLKDFGHRMKSLRELRLNYSCLGRKTFAQYDGAGRALGDARVPMLDLESFKSLTTISFTASFYIRSDYFTNPLVWITEAVSSLPPNQLRVLDLELDFDSVSNRRSHETVLHLHLHWEALRTTFYVMQPSTKLVISLIGLNREVAMIAEEQLKSLDFNLQIS